MAKKKHVRKIAIAAQKGGVGKTTTALGLADALINDGYKVLYVDAEPQRNGSTVYRAGIDGFATISDILYSDLKASECIQHTEFGDIIAGDNNLKNSDTKVPVGPKMYKHLINSLKEIEDEYDYILFDTPCQVGVILGNVLTACDEVIVPLKCEAFDIRGLVDFYETIVEFQEENEKLHVLGILVNMYDGRKNITKDIVKMLPEYAKIMNTKIFGTMVHVCSKIGEAQAVNMPLSQYSRSCSAAIAYRFIAEEIEEG